jgi:hypothetical protein
MHADFFQPGRRDTQGEIGMAEEKNELRDINYRQLLPWTELFKGFQLALDPKKLLLAAAGIMVMYTGWMALSLVFYRSRNEPKDSDYTLASYQKEGATEAEAEVLRKAQFEHAHYQWQLLHDTAGPDGALSTWPWFETRGPNPYLWATGQEGTPNVGSGWNFFTSQAMVLIEPLAKFLTPVVYLLKPNAGFWNHLYFTLVLLWTLATWAVFGGAITRMATVQLARKEKISIGEALRFTWARIASYFTAPLFPLVFVVAVLILLIVYGWLHMIPIVGDIVVDGLGWPLVLLAGLVMAVILVGLLGWPLMYATISSEGSDSFDALSRSYSYVYGAPWHYLWNSVVAIAYGAVLVFFVGFMGSLMVYLGKWGVSQGIAASAEREPAYLFVYAPTSFGWRQLLLQGSPAVDAAGAIDAARYAEYLNGFTWYNKVGAGLVACWLYLIFLAIIGFGYSYFWSASTIIYLLMRRQVDDTELDEIYVEEDESDEAYSTSVSTTTTAPTVSPSAATTPLTMVEPPALKSSTPVATAETASANGGDGKGSPA